MYREIKLVFYTLILTTPANNARNDVNLKTRLNHPTLLLAKEKERAKVKANEEKKETDIPPRKPRGKQDSTQATIPKAKDVDGDEAQATISPALIATNPATKLVTVSHEKEK
jgi:hypothetical protein